MVVSGTDKLLCDLHWGSCAYYDLAVDPREQRNLAEARPDRAAALRGLLDEWLDGHVRFEPLLRRARRIRRAGRCRRRSSAGGWAICWPGPSWPRS